MKYTENSTPVNVWTTEKVNTLLELVDTGKVDLTKVPNPFHDSNPDWRAADIVFEYTADERDELKRCAQDVMYFADQYCFAMTDDGVQNIKLRDYQQDALLTMQHNNKCVWLASRQIGKAQPLDSTLWTRKGKIRMGDVKPGDVIIGANGQDTTILGVFEQGILKVYDVEFCDGSIVKACGEHLWEVSKNGIIEILSTEQLIETGPDNYSIRLAVPIDFENEDDNEDFYSAGFKFGSGEYKLSNSKCLLKKHALGTIGQRMTFLQGVMDSCGQIVNDDIVLNLHTELCAIEMRSVVETLGMVCKINGSTIKIIDPVMDATAISESQGARWITSIKYSGEEECRCIAVDAPDHLYLTDHCIPTHNTICSGIFLTWYLLFNTDKNLMVLANVGRTTTEIVDKLKVIMKNLPFFMKPGVLVNNQMRMTFDNGCRLIGVATSKTAAIGFAVHFLYVDEFAHIPASYLDPFWRSVYPTLSANKNARCVITSTPNGQNKFYDIYATALIPKGMQGASEFVPMRVDYWQVPGRDDKWRNSEIANLGSEEDFNQEYGLQFISGSKLLLDTDSMKAINANKKKYNFLRLPELDDLDINYDGLVWYPGFDPTEISEDARFVWTIDTAGGGGGDFSVINIFLLRPMPFKRFDKNSPLEENECVSAVQVGIFRSNSTSIDDFVKIFECLLFKIFPTDQVRVAIELDFRGAVVISKITTHPKFYDDIFVHTKHSKASKKSEIGIKYNFENKYEACTKVRTLVRNGRIVITEKVTAEEFGSFGVDKKGSYSSQVGHDDAAMTVINLSFYFESDQFYEQADDVLASLENTQLDEYSRIVKESLIRQDRNDGSNESLFGSGFMDI